MERCKSHPTSMSCPNCGTNQGFILDIPEKVLERNELDVVWVTFDDNEKEVYKELFEMLKPHEVKVGQAASLAAKEVLAYRKVLERLVEEKESVVFSEGLPLMVLVANIQYAKDTEQLQEFWQGWQP